MKFAVFDLVSTPLGPYPKGNISPQKLFLHKKCSNQCFSRAANNAYHLMVYT